MSVVVQNLVKIFGQQKALDNISFQAKAGEILGFLGPNGAGKSTAMKIATTYMQATSGMVTICGLNVEEVPEAVKATIGYLPEHNPLYLEMYVREYLHFVGSVHKMSKRQIVDRLEDIIKLCGLTKEQNKKIGALSKGYRQRVGLAQALFHDPEVLVLDEPTTGLDPNQIIEIRNLIKNVSAEKTVILSTHIMQEVQALCDRVVVINNGKIVADDPIEDLKARSRKVTNVKAEFSEPVDLNKIRNITGVINVERLSDGSYLMQADAKEDIRPAVFKFATGEGITLIGMSQEETTIENIFHDLTQSTES